MRHQKAPGKYRRILALLLAVIAQAGSGAAATEAVEPALPSAAEPTAVVLLLENSLASRYFANDVTISLRAFRESAPDNHSYALVSFGSGAHVEAALAEGVQGVLTGFGGMHPSATVETNTYDAIYQTLEAMERLPGKRVLIVIGCGVDSFSKHSFGELERKVEAANTLVYGVCTGSAVRSGLSAGSSPPAGLWRGDMLMRMLASASGGEVFCPSCELGYGDAIRMIFQTLEKQ